MSEIEMQNERNWAELDQELLAAIFAKVGTADVLHHAQLVCKPWRIASFNPCVWKVVELTKLEGGDGQNNLEKMTKEAVKRSQGRMEELRIELFGSDDLLKHVIERTKSLKRLHIASFEELIKYNWIAKKQPQLEELDVPFGFCMDKDLKAIGKACPNFRCLRHNQPVDPYEPWPADDAMAYAIADSMPNLRVLQLVGNNITNEGLLQILDKCKHLESLDIRLCSHVNVNADILAKAKGLEEFKLPFDSTADIPAKAWWNSYPTFN